MLLPRSFLISSKINGDRPNSESGGHAWSVHLGFSSRQKKKSIVYAGTVLHHLTCLCFYLALLICMHKFALFFSHISGIASRISCILASSCIVMQFFENSCISFLHTAFLLGQYCLPIILATIYALGLSTIRKSWLLLSRLGRKTRRRM